MLTEADLTQKQQAAIDHLYEHDRTILIAATGEGKTAICLSAVEELLNVGHLKRVIVACPAKIVETGVWPKETLKWLHLREHVGVTDLQGDAKKRLQRLQNSKAQVIVVSLNNLEWLLDQDHGADGIIIDELSKASGKQARKVANKKQGDGFIWRVGLTATPASENFLKLYGMCKIIDNGKALGRSKQKYEDKYFNSDYNGYKLELRDGAAALIMAKVSHLVYAVEDTKADELPPLSAHNLIRFDMPSETREKYDEMKADMVVDQDDIEAVNAAVLSGKLRQIASGFLYDDKGVAIFYDQSRLDAADRWYQELEGRRGIVFYEYTAQFEQLSWMFGSRAVPNIGDFLAGSGEILLAQFNSLSHGVDSLQHTCHDILFYHALWSKDATEQSIGRVYRRGQTKTTQVTTLVCNDTLDDLVVSRLVDKGEFMKLFLAHLKG